VALAFAAGFAPPAGAVGEGWVMREQASFSIWQNDQKLGTESFRIYSTHDTLVTASTVRLQFSDSAGTFPYVKHTTYLQRAFDSYPLLFQSIESMRGDTTDTRAINCVFHDTAAVVYKQVGGTGSGETLALPPGRLYILDPGVYLQIQLLVADFLERTQKDRLQPVLIPARQQVVDIRMRRGETSTMDFGGRKVTATRVDLTDKHVDLVAWLSEDGRMWRLIAPSAGLRVERDDAADSNKSSRR
jgi:hypothetical protein